MKPIEYTITDIVETGHSTFIGGSTEISVSLSSICNDFDKKRILDIIDKLDHTIITDDEVLLKFTERYFYIKRANSFLDDVWEILSFLLQEEKIDCVDETTTIKIRKGKESLKAPIKDKTQITNLIEYNAKG